MALLELLFLLILTGYIFSRLWSVLGTRTGYERPPRDLEDREEDNVIILNRGKNGKGDEGLVIDQEMPFQEESKKIKKIEPDFELYAFQENAKHAFQMILEAFVKGDRKLLKKLVDTKVYKEFDEALLAFKKEEQTISNDIIGRIESEITDVSLHGKTAEITVRFKSQQRYITYDKAGQILDNVEGEAIPMTDLWTFSRKLGGDDPTWLLIKTRSGE